MFCFLLEHNRAVKLNQTEPITKLGSDAKTTPTVYGIIERKKKWEQICHLYMQSGYVHGFK